MLAIINKISIGLLLCGFSVNATNNLSEYYPISNNQLWEYSITENGEKYNQTVRMTSSNQEREFYIYTLGKRKSVFRFSISEGVVFLNEMQINWGPIPFLIPISSSSPIPVFYIDQIKHEQWDWLGEIGYSYLKKKVRIHFTNVGYESIAVLNKIYNCVKIKTVYEDGDKLKELISWFAKGYGLVKEESSDYEKHLIFYQR